MFRLQKNFLLLSAMALSLVLAAGPAVGASVEGAGMVYETPPVLQAGQVLPAEWLKGKRYRIEEAVPTDGFLMKFTIISDFGTFIARSPGDGGNPDKGNRRHGPAGKSVQIRRLCGGIKGLRPAVRPAGRPTDRQTRGDDQGHPGGRGAFFRPGRPGGQNRISETGGHEGTGKADRPAPGRTGGPVARRA